MRILHEPFGDSMERVSNVVEADILVVVNSDLITSPGTSRRFAKMSGARLHEIMSVCGYMALLASCDGKEITAAIREFLW